MKATGVKKARAPVASAQSEEVEELIRQRAYQIYLERGRIEGHAWDDWLQAEAEIKTRQLRKAGY